MHPKKNFSTYEHTIFFLTIKLVKLSDQDQQTFVKTKKKYTQITKIA